VNDQIKETFEVGPEDAGVRLDYFLAARTGYSRSRIAKQIENGEVEIAGRKTAAGKKLKAGEFVYWREPEIHKVDLIPEDLPVEVVYEDEYLIVVNKPSGLVVHPAPGHPSGTLVNFLLYHCKDLKPIAGELRPGIVHRLDKDTSGLLIAMKDEKALALMREQFDRHEVHKEYRALVFGIIPKDELTIDLPIGRHDKDRKRFSTKSKRGKPSVTHIKTLARYSEISLVSAVLETGRTHQIRVHLSDSKYPIVGDKTYNGDRRVNKILSKKLQERLQQVKRFMLHAKILRFKHPVTGEELSFTQPEPEDFSDLLQWLEETYG